MRFIGVPNMGAEQFITIGGKAVEGSVFVADYFPCHAVAGEPEASSLSTRSKLQPPARQRGRAGLHGDQDRGHGDQGGRPEPDPRKAFAPR